MTQEKLAENMNVSGSTINRIEQEERLPTTMQILSLCEELQVSADYILFGKADTFIPPILLDQLIDAIMQIKTCQNGKETCH